MYRLAFFWEQAQLLFERGGIVLLSILILSTLMWILIVERLWFFRHTHPRLLSDAVNRWKAREDRTSWGARRARESLISEIDGNSRRFLLPIEAIASTLPLLGLLGTVLGMISTFDVMVTFGTGNGHGFAEGISKALINSTAGLVTSIVGIYFSSRLNRRAEKERQLITNRMV